MSKVNSISKTARLLLTSRSISVQTQKLSNWTSENIVKSPHPDIVLPTRTVHEHISENLEKWANKTALVCGVTNRSYTYHQLHKYSKNFAANLRTKLKIRDGDVVCIMMANSPEYAIAVLGALEAGAEVTTVNPMYTAYEVQRQITLSSPKVTIGSIETVTVLKDALQLSKTELPIITVKNAGDNLPPGTISFQELATSDVDQSVLKEVRRNVEDIAFLPYSSGTTGLPKGVELTHSNIVANCLQLDVDGVKHYSDTTDSYQESVMGLLPFYHIYGLTINMLHKLSVGAKVVSLPKFQPNTFLPAMKEHKISLFYAVPPLILFMASHPDVKDEHLDHLRTITSGAAPLPRNDIDRVLNKVKHKLDFLQLYGLTETSPLATGMAPGSTNYSTSGFAISNTELRICDSNSNSLGPNEVGEVYIRGPQVMKGYRNNPEATKGCVTEDGWFKSGDLAKIDEKGVITIADRIKELIKVKGYQVPPAELESVLKEHPSVLDAAVIGVPDPKTGEAPKAFVVLRPGLKIASEEISQFVSKRVAEYKRVKDITFLDSLPKNPSGKILRRVLKDIYC